MKQSKIKELRKIVEKLEEDKRYWRLKAWDRGHLALSLIFLILGIALMMPYGVFFSVDEDAFCVDKIITYFPEYWTGTITYSPAGSPEIKEAVPSCKVIIDSNSSEKRDGLKLTSSDRDVLYFELTNQKDLDYLNSDDLWGFVMGLGILFEITSIMIIIHCIGERRRY